MESGGFVRGVSDARSLVVQLQTEQEEMDLTFIQT